MSTKIINPTKPSECTAALSMTEGEEDMPYASIFYTSHEGTITFFGLAVADVVQADEGQRLTFNAEGSTDPDMANVLISGTLSGGGMTLDAGSKFIELADQDAATTFVSIIRMVYSMEAQGA